jgi:Ca2+-binding EF-hand superfamily protein
MGNGVSSEPKPIDDLLKGAKFTTKELNDFLKTFKGDIRDDEKTTKQEFVKHFKDAYKTDDGQATKYSDYVFSKHDKENNGYIYLPSFITALISDSKGTRQAKLLLLFQLYDQDGSGHLTEGEIAKILSGIYKSRGLPDAKNKATDLAKIILSKADDSKDGQISEAEFACHAQLCAEIEELFENV